MGIDFLLRLFLLMSNYLLRKTHLIQISSNLDWHLAMKDIIIPIFSVLATLLGLWVGYQKYLDDKEEARKISEQNEQKNREMHSINNRMQMREKWVNILKKYHHSFIEEYKELIKDSTWVDKEYPGKIHVDNDTKNIVDQNIIVIEKIILELNANYRNTLTPYEEAYEQSVGKGTSNYIVALIESIEDISEIEKLLYHVCNEFIKDLRKLINSDEEAPSYNKIEDKYNAINYFLHFIYKTEWEKTKFDLKEYTTYDYPLEVVVEQITDGYSGVKIKEKKI